jgi:TonB family protein
MSGYVLLSVCAHAVVVAALLFLGSAGRPHDVVSTPPIFNVTDIKDTQPHSSRKEAREKDGEKPKGGGRKIPGRNGNGSPTGSASGTTGPSGKSPGNAGAAGAPPAGTTRGTGGSSGEGYLSHGYDRRPSNAQTQAARIQKSTPSGYSLPLTPRGRQTNLRNSMSASIPDQEAGPARVLVTFAGSLQIHPGVALPDMTSVPDKEEEMERPSRSPRWVVDLIQVSEVHAYKPPVPVVKPTPPPPRARLKHQQPFPQKKFSQRPVSPPTPAQPSQHPQEKPDGNQISVNAAKDENSPFGIKGGFPYAWYLDVIKSKLWEHWGSTIPAHEPEACVIRFIIQRSGEVRDVSIKSSSGNPIYDQSAENAIRDSSPFPKIPSGYSRNEIEAFVEFRFTGD